MLRRSIGGLGELNYRRDIECLGATLGRREATRFTSTIPASPTTSASRPPERLSDFVDAERATGSISGARWEGGAADVDCGDGVVAAARAAGGDFEFADEGEPLTEADGPAGADGLGEAEAFAVVEALGDAADLAAGVADDLLAAAAEGVGFADDLAAAGGGATGAGGGGGGGAGAGGGGGGGGGGGAGWAEPSQPAPGSEWLPATLGDAGGVDVSGAELPPNSTDAKT